MINTEEIEENGCSCGDYSQDEHTCPFKTDVNEDSESLCTCCEHCTQQCADDI